MRKVCLQHMDRDFFGLPGWKAGRGGRGLSEALSGQAGIVAFSSLRAELRDDLEGLAKGGRELIWLPCGREEELSLETLAHSLTPKVEVVVLPHAGDLCGTLLPIEEAGSLCRKKGIRLVVDMTNTAGRVPICRQKWDVDGILLAGRVLNPVEELLDWLEGGERLAISRTREMKLTGHFMARMRELEPDGLKVPGPREASRRTGVVSLVFPQISADQAAERLKAGGITAEVRSKVVPLVGQALGLASGQVVRMSLGPESTFEEIDYVQSAVMEIMGL